MLQVMNECLEEYIRCNEQDRELDPVALQVNGWGVLHSRAGEGRGNDGQWMMEVSGIWAGSCCPSHGVGVCLLEGGRGL